MGNHGLLLRLPAFPFTLGALLPDPELAYIASAINECGHGAQVLDYNTVTTLEQLFPERLRSGLIDLEYADSKNGITQGIRTLLAARRIREQYRATCGQIAEEVSKSNDYDFLVLKVCAPTERTLLKWILPRIRGARPAARIFVCGPVYSDEKGLARAAHDGFDGVWNATDVAGIERLLDPGLEARNRSNALWNAARGGESIASARTASTFDAWASHLLPSYESSVYPALTRETKVLVFDLGTDPGYTETPSSENVSRTLEESASIRCHHKVRAFHLRRPALPTGAGRLASELLTRSMNFRFSCDLAVSTLSSSTIALLRASGCSAIGFQVDSGSQRLIEDVYGHRFGATQVERLLRESTFNNIFTVAQLRYPSVADDYHTKAESVRLMARAKPDGVDVAIPTGTLAPNLRSGRARLERESLLHEIGDFGIETQISPRDALLADLSGYAGQEREFLDLVHWQLATGDVLGLATIVEQINAGAAIPERASLVRPFTALGNAVGN